MYNNLSWYTIYFTFISILYAIKYYMIQNEVLRIKHVILSPTQFTVSHQLFQLI